MLSISARGVATGVYGFQVPKGALRLLHRPVDLDLGYMGIYTPKCPGKLFLCGRNDVRMAIEHAY